MKQFISVASTYNTSDTNKSLSSIKELVKILDEKFEKAELILLVKENRSVF